MESNIQTPEAAVFVNDVRISLSKDRRYLLIFLPGNQIVRKPVNLFKAVMKLPYTKTSAAPAAAAQ